MKRWLGSVMLALCLACPAYAQNMPGVVTAYADLYAGPDIGYPTLAQIPAGTGVAIQGCTAGWGWCDVIVMGMRGWVPATYVQYVYQNRPVVVSDYGARIGIPIVTFTIGAYWGSYYSGHPFYRNRDYWYGRPYVPRPPPRPPGWRPGYRPPPPGYRPPPGHRHRPPPGHGHRPPNHGNKPHPGTRPPPSGGKPPGGGQRPPGPGNGKPKPQTRPAPGSNGS